MNKDSEMKVMHDTWYGRAALEKWGPVPDNFVIYIAGWMEDGPPSEWETMQVIGAEFSRYVRGEKKGQLNKPIKGTKRIGYFKRPIYKEEKPFPDLYKFEPSSGSGEIRSCFCIGPQPGQTKCPCMLRNES